MKYSTREIAKIVTFAALTVVLAVAIGIGVGRTIQQREVEQLKDKRVRLTQMVLSDMGTVAVGDTLKGIVLEDVDGTTFSIPDDLENPTVISFMNVHCDGCLLELEAAASFLRKHDKAGHFVFITTGNPIHFRKLRDNFGLTSAFLYDDGGVLETALKVSDFPFNIIVNGKGVILELRAGNLTDGELTGIFR